MRWVDGGIVRLGIATDITDRKEMAELVRQQQERLSSTARLIIMGEMASMLAHEINQPLSAIANYCSGCVARLEAGADAEAVLPAMKKASAQAERAGKIIRRIREFVKKSEPRRAPVQVAAILDDALGFAEIDAHRLNIRLVVEVAAELPDVHADRIMIEQVVINLVRNGFDAMKNTVEDERVLVVRARRSGAAAVEVAVIDRGHGINAEDRERLFTPFFTTKQEGMGIGLNICRSIIEFHDSRLIVGDNPEGGTIFAFILPTLPAEGATGE
jgi:C4-dicarboxylate-specific signal transduction histidine kinase